jgi:hypothetical protein
VECSIHKPLCTLQTPLYLVYIVTVSFITMPPKPEHDLTQVEVGFLNAASRLMAAAAQFALQLPPPSLQNFMMTKAFDEIVRTLIHFI